MSSIVVPPTAPVWKEGVRAWLAFASIAALLFVVFLPGLGELWRVWMDRPEYSFGLFIPLLSAFLIWQRKDRIERLATRGSPAGLLLVVIGVVLKFVGDLATSHILIQYGCWSAIVGVAWCYLGTAGLRIVIAPLLFLFFAMPLPEFLLQALSLRLQMISSEIGVSLIRLCNISVHLDGNIIDLGSMKLQVAEACSGLRYLFSLLTLGFIAAYFFTGAWWKRAVIFLSTIPITVAMNSFRIGLVGVTVEYFGRAAAEGVLHDFEGLVIFMGATGLLLGEMWLLANVGKQRLNLQTAFGFDLPAASPPGSHVSYRLVPSSLYLSMVVLALAASVSFALPPRTPFKPPRTGFDQFPMQIDGWRGRSEKLEQIYLDILQADDYLVADYVRDREAVNVYVQYYAAQTRAAATHSPRLCIPAGGWEIADLTDVELAAVTYRGRPLRVNRVIITRGESSLLVYYWFQQRGRNTTNEYVTKLLIFWDSLMTNRADGSMVRLITAVRPGQGFGPGDARLTEWAGRLMPILPAFIPE